MARDHEKFHYLGTANDKALKDERARKLTEIVDQHVEAASPGDRLVSFHIGLSVPRDLAVQYSSWKDLQLAISTNLRHRTTKGFLDGSQGSYVKRAVRRKYQPTDKLTKKEATAALYKHVNDCLHRGATETDEIAGCAAKNLATAYSSKHALNMGIHEVRRRIFVGDTGKHLCEFTFGFSRVVATVSAISVSSVLP
jgi:hypothetical protein